MVPRAPQRSGLVSRRLVAPVAALALLLAAAPAHAYVGPGAGFAFVTSFFLLLSTVLVVLAALLTWPVRVIWRRFRLQRPARPARADRVVIVGLDGLDPRVTREMMAAGKLPNMSNIAEKGVFSELATTCPSISPVAWSTFATGVDPSRHGIFDFLAPDRRHYKPKLSSTDIRPPRRTLRIGPLTVPLSKPSIRLMRRGVPFWTVLGRHGVDSSILRVPITYPPDRFDGTQLSAMCAPDLLGTQGSFTFFTSESEDDAPIGGRVVRVQPVGNRVHATLPGPPHPLRTDGTTLELPLRLDLDHSHGRATLHVAGKRVALERDRYSDWVELRFSAPGAPSLSGICRFRLTSLDPLQMYVTPINIDPARPAQPVSTPVYFSVFLAKLMGRFGTLGLAEDTWALNEGVIDEAGFLEQVALYQRERETMFFEMLRRTDRGVLACVFDATDRVQHMFMRDYGNAQSDNHLAIEDIYRQMDEMLGRVLAEVNIDDPRQVLMVVSDHGFAAFDRGVHLNTWLRDQGYLHLDDGVDAIGEYLEGVDWSRTRAYALGLSGLYLNVKGRERDGVVLPAEAAALRAEIGEKLLALRDPAREGRPILRVFDPNVVYSGPFLDDAPDLIVGYARGYRASWDTARGMGGKGHIEDNTRHWSGDHCMDPREVPGVIFSSRPLHPGKAGPRMLDVAPTVLDLFGIDPPPNMTGRSMAAEPGTGAEPPQPEREAA